MVGSSSTRHHMVGSISSSNIGSNRKSRRTKTPHLSTPMAVLHKVPKRSVGGGWWELLCLCSLVCCTLAGRNRMLLAVAQRFLFASWLRFASSLLFVSLLSALFLFAVRAMLRSSFQSQLRQRHSIDARVNVGAFECKQRECVKVFACVRKSVCVCVCVCVCVSETHTQTQRSLSLIHTHTHIHSLTPVTQVSKSTVATATRPRRSHPALLNSHHRSRDDLP